MTVANIYEAKTQLSKLIQSVLNGEEVIIAKAGNPIIELIQYKPRIKQKKRRFGTLKGKIKWDEETFHKADAEIQNLFLKSTLDV